MSVERVQKVIAASGYCSRRKAEELIKKGLVYINGDQASLGDKVSGNDYIEVEGNAINEKQDKVYYLLNKPRGVITSTTDDKGRKTVVDIIDTNTRIYPVGRLDYDTTGLLILTNDGELANLLTHPKNNIDKVYITKIEGLITKGNLRTLENGVVIDGKKTAKSKAKILRADKKTNTTVVELTIHEGRNHQVKNMFKALGYNVIKLKRERISFLTVEGLSSRDYRQLSIHEVKKLYNEAKN